MEQVIANQNDIIENFEQAFQQFEQSLEGEVKHTLHQTRLEAFHKFKNLGLPSTKHEEWKYTPIAKQLKLTGDFTRVSKASSIAPIDIEPVLMKGLEANVLVFVNGKFSPYNSTILSPIHEVEILSLDRAIEKRAPQFEEYFNKIAKTEGEAFVNLNTAFAAQGAFIYVPEGVEVELPIVLHFVADAKAGQVLAHPRNLIVLGKASKVTIVETFSSIGEHSAFTNLVSEVHLAQNADLTYIKLQTEGDKASQVNHTEVYQEKESISNVFTYSLSGGMVRNNLNLRIAGEKAVGNMTGLYLLDGKTHIDNHTLVDHLVPNCESNELYKGVLDGQSTGVFNGKIFVKPDAQKTNAFQSNRNILLSDDATVDTKPQLEIFANDVKCSHGCTIGSLDEEPLFYLRSRGIDERKAKALLLHAFAGETITAIENEFIRTHIAQLIDKKLGFVEE